MEILENDIDPPFSPVLGDVNWSWYGVPRSERGHFKRIACTCYSLHRHLCVLSLTFLASLVQYSKYFGFD
jgi:hypothetical protein